MKLPTEQIHQCPPCGSSGRSYNPDCRGCYVRWLTRMGNPQKRGQYQQIADHHGQVAADIIMAEVEAYYRKNKSWGTFA